MTHAIDFETVADPFGWQGMIGIAPVSDRGNDWLAENVDYEDYQDAGGMILMEGRCGFDVLLAALDDGLVLQDRDSGRIATRQ